MLKFGGVEAMKQDYRAKRGLLLIENLLQDARFGLHLLRKVDDSERKDNARDFSSCS
jgi:hypothetical protein